MYASMYITQTVAQYVITKTAWEVMMFAFVLVLLMLQKLTKHFPGNSQSKQSGDKTHDVVKHSMCTFVQINFTNENRPSDRRIRTRQV